MKKIILGIEAKDKITGFKGMVIAKSTWLTGCDQYALKRPVGEDGKMTPSEWFDEGQLEFIGEGIYEDEVKSKKKGGPRTDLPLNR